MTDILFFLSYISPFVFLYLYRNNGWPHVVQINCSNFMILTYIIAAHMGLLILYLNPDGFAQLKSVDKSTILLLSLYSNILVVMYIITGYIIPKSVNIRLVDYSVLKTIKIRRGIIIVLCLVTIPFVYLKIMDNSPLLILLTGDAVAANVARVTQVSTNSFFLGIKPSYLKIIFNVLTYFMMLLMISIMVNKKNTINLALLFLVFIIVFMDSVSNVSKGALVLPLYLIVLSYSLVYAKGVLINKVSIYAFFYILAIVSVITAWVMNNTNIDYLYPFHRLVMGNLLPQYVVVNAIGFENLLYGTTSPSWMSLGSHKQFLLDMFAWRELLGGSDKYFYTAPSSFIAEAHANWHIFGVLIISFLMLLALRTLDYLIKTTKNPLVYSAMLVYSALYFSGLSIKGYTGFLVDYYYWAVLIFALFIYKMRIKYKSRRD